MGKGELAVGEGDGSPHSRGHGGGRGFSWGKWWVGKGDGSPPSRGHGAGRGILGKGEMAGGGMGHPRFRVGDGEGMGCRVRAGTPGKRDGLPRSRGQRGTRRGDGRFANRPYGGGEREGAGLKPAPTTTVGGEGGGGGEGWVAAFARATGGGGGGFWAPPSEEGAGGSGGRGGMGCRVRAGTPGKRDGLPRSRGQPGGGGRAVREPPLRGEGEGGGWFETSPYDNGWGGRGKG